MYNILVNKFHTKNHIYTDVCVNVFHIKAKMWQGGNVIIIFKKTICK